MEKTWKPTVAGILDIVAGVFSLFGILGLVFFALGVAKFMEFGGADAFGVFMPGNLTILIWGGVAFLAITGILAVVGGIYALQRKNWGLALTGSIAASLPSSLLGILAIIFTAMSRDEFE